MENDEKNMKKTPENVIKKQVSDWLDIHGWFHFPILQSLGSYRGIPDKIAVKAGIVLFLEMKSQTGTLSKYQKEFRRRIIEKGGHYLVVKSEEDIKSYLEQIKSK